MNPNNLTDEQKRVVIAEACGWKQVRAHWEKEIDGEIVSAYCNAEMHAHRQLPDYLNSLDAMHEAIMAQPQTVRDSINYRLMESQNPSDSYILDRTINATARQRAEAFIRCLP